MSSMSFFFDGNDTDLMWYGPSSKMADCDSNFVDHLLCHRDHQLSVLQNHQITSKDHWQSAAYLSLGDLVYGLQLVDCDRCLCDQQPQSGRIRIPRWCLEDHSVIDICTSSSFDREWSGSFSDWASISMAQQASSWRHSLHTLFGTPSPDFCFWFKIICCSLPCSLACTASSNRVRSRCLSASVFATSLLWPCCRCWSSPRSHSSPLDTLWDWLTDSVRLYIVVWSRPLFCCSLCCSSRCWVYSSSNWSRSKRTRLWGPPFIAKFDIQWKGQYLWMQNEYGMDAVILCL